MNYLAHIYLSGDDEKTIVGNFIGDYVKGNKFRNYPESIQKGILLHRKIDSFTDEHKNYREAKKLFRDDFGLYSGIVIDLFYDHFLAKNWRNYKDESLRSFAKKTHAILLSHFFQLPQRVQGFLPFLIQHKRLESYATIEGIQKSLEIMGRYTSLPEKSENASITLKKNYSFLENNFSEFILEIIGFIHSEYDIKIITEDFQIRS